MNISMLFWDQAAKSFDNREKQVEPIRHRAVEQTRQYLRGNEVLLDFGCGTGTLAVELAGSVQAVLGIDISAKMIAAARRKAVEQHLANVAFKQVGLFDAHLQPAAFDVVMATGILHLMKRPGQVVHRIAELLKPGGWFISTTPCIGGDETAATWINRILFLPGHMGIFPYVRFFRIADLERTMTQGGFQIVAGETLLFGAQHEGRYIVARLIMARKQLQEKP